ncbi:MAG: hypothetical protein RIF32_17925 [Leptospirales bacterium]|jgi:hypothetical protein
MPSAPETGSGGHSPPPTKRALSILGLASLYFFVSVSLDLGANVPVENDAPVWTRLKVQEAFISRATTEKFRDAFSAPEFGWKIFDAGGRVLARGALYADLYFPVAPDDARGGARLALIERDVFQDDAVASIELRPGVSRYQMTGAGDFVQLERMRVEPDRASGGDARPADARRLSNGTFAGGVDFAAGDYTDYIRLPGDASAVLILRENFTLHWDLPGLYSTGDVLRKRFRRRSQQSPREDSPGTEGAHNGRAALPPFVYPSGASGPILLDLTPEIADATRDPRVSGGQGVLLRLRGRIGGGAQRYRILSVANAKSRSALLQRWLAFVRARKSGPGRESGDPASAAIVSSIPRAKLAEAFLEYDSAASAETCRRRLGLKLARPGRVAPGSGADQERVFCAQLLYELERPEDLNALTRRFANESKFYQTNLRFENSRVEREREKARKADETRESAPAKSPRP